MEEVLKLYLQKRDDMNEREREVFIAAIELANKPIFTCSDESDIRRIIPS